MTTPHTRSLRANVRLEATNEDLLVANVVAPVSIATKSTSCSGFVGELARLAGTARRSLTPEEAGRRLAVELVYRYVPKTSILGVRVRRRIVGPDPVPSRDDTTTKWGADGFRNSLVRGGQNEEVVRHVAAAAACVLVGRGYLVRLASAYDWMQGLFRNRIEAQAELAGNQAGLRVGRVLREFLAGRLEVTRLRPVLAAILCK